jgi:hypothetical protein
MVTAIKARQLELAGHVLTGFRRSFSKVQEIIFLLVIALSLQKHYLFDADQMVLMKTCST